MRWLCLPSIGLDSRERISEWAPCGERALILRAEEVRANLEYVDIGEEDQGSVVVCEVQILIRLSAAELATTDGWTFSPVSEAFTFRPRRP